MTPRYRMGGGMSMTKQRAITLLQAEIARKRALEGLDSERSQEHREVAAALFVAVVRLAISGGKVCKLETKCTCSRKHCPVKRNMSMGKSRLPIKY